LVKTNEKVPPPVSIALESHATALLASLVVVCGTFELFVQVTVSPTLTVTEAGEKL